jgi:APA family basic amino acid/polyamine antiporter
MGELARQIGLFGLTASGVGIILGAGIYALIGSAAGVTGNAVWISFLLGAFISSFTGLSYAELSSAIPKAAAEYFYAKEAFGNTFVPFLVGWIILFTGTVSASTVALGFAGYITGFFGTPIVFTSVMLIILLSLLNFVGIEESSRLNILFTLIEVSGLVLIVILAIPSLGRVNYFEAPAGLSGILKASVLIFFAYLGFEDVVNLSEEAKNPERDVPKALILSVIISAVLYVLVAIAVVSLVDWQELGLSSYPIALAASKSMGKSAFLAMSVIALFATSNTVLILLVVSSRMIFGMAKDGSLPSSLAKVSTRGTPWVAIVVTMILSSLFVLLGNIEFVAEVTNFGTFIIFASVNLSAIVLRFRKPTLRGGFRTPLALGKMPLIPLVGLLSSGLLIPQLNLNVIALGLAVILLGVIVAIVTTRKTKRLV